MSDYLHYIPRIRSYYQALGYGAPYVWAAQQTVPLTPLVGPVSAARVGVVTTAAPFRPDIDVDQAIGAPVTGLTKLAAVTSVPADRAPDLRLTHVAYDTTHTRHNDPRTYNPVATLHDLAAQGVIGAVGPRVHCVPTNRSQRTTRMGYADAVVMRCLEDRLDAVVLVPICPVCHQSMALIATRLEAAGLPTVVMGAARDIVEHVGTPRLLHSDLPLGNPCGPPDDTPALRDTAIRALGLLTKATAPRTTETSPHVWPGAKTWRQDYSNADLLSAQEIAARRAAFDHVKVEARAKAGDTGAV